MRTKFTCASFFFYYCIYALGFHPTREPISAKAKVAHNQRQEKKNGGVFFAFAKEDLPQKKSRMGSRKATILVRTYASKPIRRVINRSGRVIERKIIHLRRKKTLWLNDRQPVKVVKTLNDRQFYIFDKFRKIE